MMRSKKLLFTLSISHLLTSRVFANHLGGNSYAGEKEAINLGLSLRQLSFFPKLRGGGLWNASVKRPFKSWTFDSHCNVMSWTEMPKVKLVVSFLSLEDNSGEWDKNNDDLVIICVSPSESRDVDSGKDESDLEKKEVEEYPTIELTGKLKQLNDDLNGLLNKILEENKKTFKNGAEIGGTTATVRIPVVPAAENDSVKLKRYILLGLGKNSRIEGGSVSEKRDLGRKLGAALASKCSSEIGIRSCTVLLPEESASFVDGKIISELSESFMEGLYADNRYKSGDKKKKPAENLESVRLVIERRAQAEDSKEEEIKLNAAISVGLSLAKGVYLTKDIVNSPHNVLNSVSLAETAKKIAYESGGHIKCNILEKEDCESRGMGAYLGVARGSETPPKFIHLVYRPKGKTGDLKKLGIVGKGLLFDTGGYNIKTQMMELMKFDCGGAAAVLGATRALGELQPEGVEVHIVVAACENMINDKAVVPGDVLIAANGKTIEVGNTDAEGRLTMADALVFVDEELGCNQIIELSTLTGACVVALGNKIAGMWSTDDDLAAKLITISKCTGEKVWRMPLEIEYNEQIQSKIADIKNIGKREGGAITAALFLQKFVSKSKPFAHIDIAGPVWSSKEGATGFGAKLVCEWILWNQKEECAL